MQFPRILGIEAVGTVVSAPGSSLTEGQVVATAMGGYLGRAIDGGYAGYTCVPADHVQVGRLLLCHCQQLYYVCAFCPVGWERKGCSVPSILT